MAFEGLAVLNIACNVMQVLQYGSQLIQLVHQTYSQGDTGCIAELEAHSKHVQSATDTLQTSMRGLTSSDRQDRCLHNLCDLSQKCSATADELRQCIAALPRPNKKRDVFGIVWWLLRRKRHIDRIKQRLDLYQQDLDTRILVDLSLKIDAICLQTHDSVSIKQELNALIQDLADRQRRVLEQNYSDRDTAPHAIDMDDIDIPMGSGLGRRGFRLHQNSSQYHYSREKLLSSLEYPSMNARRNQIPPPQTSTFDWLFRCPRLQTDRSAETSAASWDSFETWLEDTRGIYWINGKAGSGKSTLMKFVVNHPSTVTALGKWAKGQPVLILSHYFWTSGNIHERSLKGFFQTILHQVLIHLSDAIPYLLSTSESLNSKKTSDDWSEIELIRTFETVQSSFKTRTCLFIDGLDEADESSETSQSCVLDFIRSQAKRNDVKVCVSSRPLARYERSFAHCQTLRLQDLTERDISLVIDDGFQYLVPSQCTNVNDLALREMREEIMRKADGVFLWVSLVLKSLIRGFENGDSLQILQRRLALLPSELENLYARMWTQLNQDEELYREEAAFLFVLVLHREDFWMVNTDEHNSYCRSLLFFTMVINGVDIKSVLPEFREAAVAQIEMQCISMMQMIRTRCAGILEVVGPEQTKKTSLANANLFHERLGRFVVQEVRFIHRSAYAFLVETSFGKSLLAACPFSRIDIAIRIIQSAVLFWHTKITNQGELPYTLHLAERFMVQHARTRDERQRFSEAIRATLEMYKSLGGWSSTEQDGSYLLYQYIDPAIRYHTVDTAGWMLSFATRQIFDEAYRRHDTELNPEFTDYLLLCLASQVHFRVSNPRHHEQEEHLEFLMEQNPNLSRSYFLRYPYPFKKSAALLLTEKLIYDILEADHQFEPYRLMEIFFTQAVRLGWDLSAKFVVLWSMEEMYRSIIMPIERLFVPGSRFGTATVLEVNLCYLVDLILLFGGHDESRQDMRKAVESLVSSSPDILPHMRVILVSAAKGTSTEGFRDERQRLDDINARQWRSLSEEDAARLKTVYEQYQASRSEAYPSQSSRQAMLSGIDDTNLPDTVEACAQKGTPQHFFRFLESEGYCKRPDDPEVMHKAPRPFLPK